MARRPRLSQAGQPMHIVQRGNNRGACFVADDDRLFFIGQLTEVAAATDCAVHAYVLMTNHVHLLVTPGGDDGASRLMRELGRRYVQAFSRAHRRTGTLWEGRFRSCVIGTEGYMLACYRYIELNPVRAGIASDPHDHPWSSHRVNATGTRSRLVTPHRAYLDLGPDAATRACRYRELFARPIPDRALDALRQATRRNQRLDARDMPAPAAMAEPEEPGSEQML